MADNSEFSPRLASTPSITLYVPHLHRIRRVPSEIDHTIELVIEEAVESCEPRGEVIHDKRAVGNRS